MAPPDDARFIVRQASVNETPDATPRARQAVHSASTPLPPRSPVKDCKEPAKEPTKEPASPSFAVKERARSNSLSAPAQGTRKRTSSGVFQVDETEPPPKKPEPVRSPSENSRKRPEVNGRKEMKKEKQEKKVIERFDTESDTKCVSAFKESDSWD